MASNKCKPMPQLSAKDIERFWSLVDKRGPDECWPWMAGRSDRGYGKFCVNRNKKNVHLRSHRIAIFVATGIDPFPLLTCHSCDNPPCCNPNHLFNGDVQDNSDDMVKKGRAATGDRSGMRLHPESVTRGDDHPFRKHPELVKRGEDHWSRHKPERLARGENNFKAKLTESQVIELRKRASGGERLLFLAREFGVSKSTIIRVVDGTSWSHIPL